MYTLTFRDYLKVAHSLDGEIFGPAQIMHVVTYEIDTTYTTDTLDEYGIIVDFAAAQETLEAVLKKLNFKNLDEVEDLKGMNTTTEVLCKFIHDEMCREIADKYSGMLKITMRESPVAWCTYEAPVAPPA